MKTCAACKWGRFQMTNHKPPRPRPRRSGECEYPLPYVTLPRSVTRAYGYRGWEKGVVWPETSDCPTWEAK